MCYLQAQHVTAPRGAWWCWASGLAAFTDAVVRCRTYPWQSPGMGTAEGLPARRQPIPVPAHKPPGMKFQRPARPLKTRKRTMTTSSRRLLGRRSRREKERARLDVQTVRGEGKSTRCVVVYRCGESLKSFQLIRFSFNNQQVTALACRQ